MAIFSKIETAVIHDGMFHLDEILSLVLIELFYNKKFKITRTRDMDLINELRQTSSTTVFIDVGMEYDGVSEFDHHQNGDLPAACELVWKAIKKDLSLKGYDKLERLVIEASMADTGRQMPTEFSLGNTVLAFNEFGEESGFEMALQFVRAAVSAIKAQCENTIKAKEIVEKSEKVLGGKAVELKAETRAWKQFLNGEKTPEVEHVFWYDEKRDKYLLGVTPESESSFNLHGTPLKKEDTKADFIHEKSFFGVFSTKEDLLSHLEDLYKKSF